MKSVVLLFVSIFMLVIPNIVHAGRATIQITDCTQLQNLNVNARGNYVLANDIDCSTSGTLNNGAGFLPIAGGLSERPFAGTLDGQGHAINNLHITTKVSKYDFHAQYSPRGLFGKTDGAFIKNLRLRNLLITGGGLAEIGGLVGFAKSTRIEDVSIDVNSQPRGSFIVSPYDVTDRSGLVNSAVGGLVGRADEHSSISRSSVNAFVFGGKIAGGLVGANKGIISQCFTKGPVYGSSASGAAYAGGLVGFNESPGTVINSFGTGTVTAGGGLESFINQIVQNVDSFVFDGDKVIKVGSGTVEFGCEFMNFGNLEFFVTEGGLTVICDAGQAGGLVGGGGGAGAGGLVNIGGIVVPNVGAGGAAGIAGGFGVAGGNANIGINNGVCIICPREQVPVADVGINWAVGHIDGRPVGGNNNGVVLFPDGHGVFIVHPIDVGAGAAGVGGAVIVVNGAVAIKPQLGKQFTGQAQEMGELVAIDN